MPQALSDVSGPARADRWPKRPFLWLAIAIVVATFLQSYHLLQTPLWPDEIITEWIGRAPTNAAVIERTTRTHALGPCHYLLVHATSSVIHNETLAMRAPSVVFGVASVALLFMVGTALLDRAFGAFLSMAAALEATTVYAGRDGRPYSLALMAALLAVWGFLRWRGGGKRLWLALYVVGMAILVHANYVFALLVAPLGLFLLIAGAPPRSRVWALAEFAVASALAAAALIPLVPCICFGLRHSEIRLEHMTAPVTLGRPPILHTVALYGCLACAMALGLAAGLFRRKLTAGGIAERRVGYVALLGVLWYGVPVAALVVFNVFFRLRLWSDRYFTAYLGGPLLLAALPTVLAGRRTRLPLLYGTIFLSLLAAQRLADFQRNGTFSRPEPNRDLKAIIERVLEGTESGDLVLWQSWYFEGDLLGSDAMVGSEQLLADYLLSPVRVLAAESPSATLLPLPRTSQIAPFEEYYDEVVVPAICKCHAVVLVSQGVHRDFEEWLARKADEATPDASFCPWELVASHEFHRELPLCVRRYCRKTP